MVTEELIQYIKNQNEKGTSRDLIISRLAQAGWHFEDIQEGMNKVGDNLNKKESEPKIEKEKNSKPDVEESAEHYVVDPYHEPIGDEPRIEIKTVNSENKEEIKSEVKEESKKEKVKPIQPYSADPYHEVIADKPNVEIPVESKQEESKIEKSNFFKKLNENKRKQGESNNLNFPPTQGEKVEALTKEEVSKIWTPSTIKPIEEISDQSSQTDLELDSQPKVPKESLVESGLGVKTKDDSTPKKEPYTLTNTLETKSKITPKIKPDIDLNLDDVSINDASTINNEVGAKTPEDESLLPNKIEENKNIPEIKEEQPNLIDSSVRFIDDPEPEHKTENPANPRFDIQLNKKEESPAKIIEEAQAKGIGTEKNIMKETPDLIPKIMIENKPNLRTVNTPKKQSSKELNKDINTKKIQEIRMPPSNNSLSEKAMLASYSKDIVSANNIKKDKPKDGKRHILKYIIIVFIIGVLGVGIFFLVKNNKVKINLSSIFSHKNVKMILSNDVDNFSLLKSYKVGTEINITFPILNNINTTNNSTGTSIDTTSSNNTNWFMFSSNKIINRATASTPRLFNYDLVLKSSLWGQNLETNINSDGNNLYINIPDMNFALDSDAPLTGLIQVPSNNLGQINQIIPSSLQEEINNSPISKIILASLLDNTTPTGLKTLLKNFIDSDNFTLKGDEDINGISTSHYVIKADVSLTSNFLNSISDVLFPNVSTKEKVTLKSFINSISISSLEVWIGNKDNNVYQYKVALNIPFSKITNTTKESNLNKKVGLTWQSTYSDFNILNNIIAPPGSMSVDDYMKNTKNLNLKNIMLSFSSSANLMKTAIGNYGKKSNLKGSCTDPTSGSLFSSSGQPKDASSASSSITSVINNIVTQIGSSIPLCYSTPKAWAVASPQINDSTYYFCVDSTGNSTVLTAPITGPICQ